MGLNRYKEDQTKNRKQTKQSFSPCPYHKKCGGCTDTGIPYAQQLEQKNKRMKKILGKFGTVAPIIGMEQPEYYRCKVHRVFGYTKKTGIISGIYAEHSHRIVAVDDCRIEDQVCQDILKTITELAKSFKYKIYDEGTRTGLLRHALIRKGYHTGEVLVVLVLASQIMPGKNNFIKALTKRHPEISTIVLNVNNQKTSMILGDKEKVIYGPGFIRDRLCGCTFRISADSFYQVNPAQTEILYQTAIQMARLRKEDRIIDAYCGTGTIGLAAVKHAYSLIGIELNRDAVRDARKNAKENNIANAKFIEGDSGKCLIRMAEAGTKAEVLFMDPPRSGSTEAFMRAATKIAPKKIVYVSCNPDTLTRDLNWLTKHGYRVQEIQPIDLFPMTSHVETVVSMSRKQ